MGLRYDSHYREAALASLRTQRSFTVGLGHTHSLTCQAAKATSIAGQHMATKGERRAVLGHFASNNVIFTTDRRTQLCLKLSNASHTGMSLKKHVALSKSGLQGRIRQIDYL